MQTSVTTEVPVTVSARKCHSRCLVCGNRNPRSLSLSFQAAEDGGVRTRFKARADLQGYDDILHGGIIAALLDGAMTHCLFFRGIQAVTGDLHVRFVEPITCDVDMDIRAWMLSSRPPLYRLRAEILVDERVMAWAEAKFMRRREH